MRILHPINIDSSININKTALFGILAKAGVLVIPHFNIPVYLVSPETMDKIYPPERRLLLDPHCAKEIITAMDNMEMKASEQISEFTKMLSKCVGPSSVFVARGLYLSSVASAIQRYPEFRNSLVKEEGNAIFLCPERIQKSAHKISQILGVKRKNIFELLLQQVLIHELAHAYMDEGNSIKEPWERVIEESLANAFVHRCVCSDPTSIETLIFKCSIVRQPVEYQGCETFIMQTLCEFTGLESFAKSWARRESVLAAFTTLMAPLGILSLPELIKACKKYRGKLKRINNIIQIILDLITADADHILKIIYYVPEDPRLFWEAFALHLLRALL